MFNGIKYFKKLATECKACSGYTITECSGPQGIEGMMYEFRKAHSFVMVDDTTVGSTVVNRAGGAFDRRTFTVFLIKVHTRDSMTDYETKMEELRFIYRLFLSRMLKDKVELALRNVYLQMDSIYYKEPGPLSFNGAAGLYFMVTVDEPVNLCYDEEQWKG